jgi:hypothetical protein
MSGCVEFRQPCMSKETHGILSASIALNKHMSMRDEQSFMTCRLVLLEVDLLVLILLYVSSSFGGTSIALALCFKYSTRFQALAIAILVPPNVSDIN